MRKIPFLAIVAFFAALMAFQTPAQALVTVTVCKVTVPAGGTGFQFAWANTFGPQPPFVLNDSSTNPANCNTINITNSDKFNKFTETVPAGWALTNIACVHTTSVINITGANANPAFQPGDTIAAIDQNEAQVTCTFKNKALVNVHCDLKVTKTAAPNPVQSGQQLTFTITVTNMGNGACQPGAFPGTSLQDAQPAGVTFAQPVGITQIGVNANWACSHSLPANNLACGTQTALPPGSSATFTFTATVTAPPNSKIKNCATVHNQFDTNPNNDQDCVTVKVVP